MSYPCLPKPVTGDYRQQLRAKHLVRRGDCAATVFPFSRRDGPVSEVLFFDGGPRDADKRILTIQASCPSMWIIFY